MQHSLWQNGCRTIIFSYFNNIIWSNIILTLLIFIVNCLKSQNSKNSRFQIFLVYSNDSRLLLNSNQNHTLPENTGEIAEISNGTMKTKRLRKRKRYFTDLSMASKNFDSLISGNVITRLVFTIPQLLTNDGLCRHAVCCSDMDDGALEDFLEPVYFFLLRRKDFSKKLCVLLSFLKIATKVHGFRLIGCEEHSLG
ncbi:hypothetical protein BDC45DRAFT_534205 [Circinella umbellata]|nr:hypothetical protein BDC45DRAFT_534205 [Circinella umbellata]